MHRILIEGIMVFFILQWNARSLIANGEYKRYIYDLEHKPDIQAPAKTFWGAGI